MGLLKDPYELTSADIGKGHVVNLDSEQLSSELSFAGLEVIWVKGSFIKLVPDNELLSSSFYTSERLNGMFEMSGHLDPNLCAELVVRCKG